MDKTVWDNSDELRHSIERELDNWGAWSRQGGGTNLGFPQNIPGAGPPERDPPRPVNVEKAWQTENVFKAWRQHSTTRDGDFGCFLLKLKYMERQPLEKMAHDFNRKFRRRVGNGQIRAMLDEYEFFYYLLTSE